MTTPVLLEDLAGGVLLLTWNRPERNNGWNIELEEAYFGRLIAAAGDPAVKVIVVTGAGRTFCPGLDLEALTGITQGIPMANRRRWPMTTAMHIPKPIIAAINGACAGIGMVQAAAADLRFAAKGAKLTTAFARRGLPAENGLSWLLPRLIGTGNAMDLMLSGRVVTAEEACELGLVNRCYEPDELLTATLEYARDMAANCSPLAMATIKQQVHGDWMRSAEESRYRAIDHVAELTSSDDFQEGVASFREKRAPAFEGLSRPVELSRGWYR